MFSLDKKTIMKRDIIELLDAQTKPISSKEIRRSLGSGSLTTILALCREVQEDLTAVYQDERVSIEITKNGIFLNRHESSLQYIYDYLFSSDLFYLIMKELVRRRSVSTINFCLETGVSESTLKRKVRQINAVIKSYNFKISVSRELTISGNEVDIRIICYAFLFNVHRQFSRIPWLTKEKTIPLISKNILEYLGIEATDIKVELLAIWVYIISISISFKKKYTMSNRQLEIIQCLEIPEKPDFLKTWSQNDWVMTVAVMYGSENYGVFIEKKLSAGNPLSKTMDLITDNWLRLFQQFFTKLTNDQRNYAVNQLFQQFVHSNFLSSVDNVTKELANEKIGMLDFSKFAVSAPNYASRFELFWQKYKEYLPESEATLPYIKTGSLLLSVYLCPIQKLHRRIKIYLYTDLTALYETYLKQRIQQFLQEEYVVHFEESPHAANIIVTTVPLSISEKLKDKNKHQKIALIRSTIQEHDLHELAEIIQEIS